MYAATTKQQLARAYAPDLTPHGALKRLSRWIKQCPPLLKALKKRDIWKLKKKFQAIKSGLFASI